MHLRSAAVVFVLFTLPSLRSPVKASLAIQPDDSSRSTPAGSLLMTNVPDAAPHEERETPEPAKAPKKFKVLPIGLLSFDGGGIKGVLSTRLMAYSLQYLLSEPGTPKDDDSLGKSWQKRLVKYVDAYEPCMEVMWIVWAQQLDSMQIEPQVKLQRMKKWMDLSWSNDEHKTLIRSMLRIDLAFEFYIAHVLGISGTSTGGIIAVGTMLRMSLTQLIAMYMDPKICRLIFKSSLWRPGAGLWQAKYLQSGVEELANRVLRFIAPGNLELLDRDQPTRKFVEAACTFNDCIKARIYGTDLPTEEATRILFTLRRAASTHPNIASSQTAAEVHLSNYEGCIKEASQFLDLAKRKRTKISLGSETNGDKRSLSQLRIHDDSTVFDAKYFATRFLVTSRCVNNGAAVVFDSNEKGVKVGDKEVMNAREALQFGDKVLNVLEMEVKDVIMATSAAPYFFPAHEVELNGDSTNATMKIFFHDGGVMANDPGLINACIAYRHFTSRNKPETRFFPVFRLLRVGCGKSERWEQSPVKWNTLQGASIVTSLPDIFMSSDTRRTNLLARILDETYVLQDFKLDSYVPTGPGRSPELPMDKSSTIDLVNGLFTQLHQDLGTKIAIPEDELRTAVDRAADSPPEGDYAHAVKGLVRSLRNAAAFLNGTESAKDRDGKEPEEIPEWFA